MAERSCELALRQCRHALRTIHIHTPHKATRAFSNTTARRKQGALPTFTPTSSPELDTLLTTVRTNIFLPSSIRLAQRKLIFRTRHHAMLRAEPLQITLDSETHILQPLDATKDVPDSWKSLKRAMELMGTSRAAWQNFPALLSGMHAAGRRWQAYQWNRIIRTAGEAGMARVVVEAARQAKYTGLQLREPTVVREAMYACRQRALKSGWAAGETYKALSCAERLAELFEEKEHWGASRGAGPDPRTQQDIIAVIVELAGVLAKKQGEDKNGKLKTYAERLMPNVRRVVPESMQQGEEHRESARNDVILMRWVPLREALKLSLEVLGDACPRREVAERIVGELGTVVGDAGEAIRAQMARDQVEEKRRGLVWLEDADERVLGKASPTKKEGTV